MGSSLKIPKTDNKLWIFFIPVVLHQNENIHNSQSCYIYEFPKSGNLRVRILRLLIPKFLPRFSASPPTGHPAPAHPESRMRTHSPGNTFHLGTALREDASLHSEHKSHALCSPSMGLPFGTHNNLNASFTWQPISYLKASLIFPTEATKPLLAFLKYKYDMIFFFKVMVFF